MSSSIKLYTNAASPETIDKQSSLTLIEDLTCEFKAEIDVLRPVVTVKLTNTTTLSKIMTKVNYVYITAFERYYYVTGIRGLYNDVAELSLEVDPLYSWKTAILAQKVIIARTEDSDKYSLYLDDAVLKLYNNPNITTIEFPTGFTSEEYILAVAGGS